MLLVVLLAGSLFGYDQGVISGALAGIERSFSLSLLMVQVVTSWVTLGALAGSLVAGALGDRLGRKRTILVASACFTCGTVLEAIAPNAGALVMGRLIAGVGVGIAAVAAPLYAAELAPASLRGRFIASYQLAIASGIFLAYLVNGTMSSADWRLMLAVAAAPGIALFVVAMITPESPRWLLMKGRRDDATRELRRIQPDIAAGATLDVVGEALRANKRDASWAELFHREWRRPLIVGLTLAVLQQVTGINAVIYYAGQIFTEAGLTTEATRASMTTWAIGGVNVLATLIAVVFIDRIGRRKLLLAGLVGMGLSLAAVGVAFHFIATPDVHALAATGAMVAVDARARAAGIVMVIALVGFIGCFAFSLGPVTWTVINEIFPSHVRSRGVALATAVNWGAAWLLSQFFLSMLDILGSSSTFLLLSLVCGVGWIWVYRRLPETKGIALEEVDALWRSHP